MKLTTLLLSVALITSTPIGELADAAGFVVGEAITNLNIEGYARRASSKINRIRMGNTADDLTKKLAKTVPPANGIPAKKPKAPLSNGEVAAIGGGIVLAGATGTAGVALALQ